MKERIEPVEDDFWTERRALFPAQFPTYSTTPEKVWGRLHTSEEHYASSRHEIIPISEKKGTRTYVMMQPYTYCISSFDPRLHHLTYCYYNRFLPASNTSIPMRGGEKMTPVWAQRREELLSDCLVSPDVFKQMVDRLGEFVVPYQQALEAEAGPHPMQLYLQGLLAHLPRKNAEEIAIWVDVERQVIQDFIGTAPWDHRPLVTV